MRRSWAIVSSSPGPNAYVTALGLEPRRPLSGGSLSLLLVVSALSPAASRGAVVGLSLPQWPSSEHAGPAPENLGEHAELPPSLLPVPLPLVLWGAAPPQGLSSSRVGGGVEDAGDDRESGLNY